MEGSAKVTVSVVIPVYNAEKYLKECLDSVCSQTLENFEVICVDDCSTDNSMGLLKLYEERFPFLHTYKQKTNMGPGPARNTAIAQAKGEYIAFMDSDDAFHCKDSLKTLYENAVVHGALICGGGIRFVDPQWMENNVKKYSFEHSCVIDYRDYQLHYYYQRFIFQREMLVSNHILFPSYMRMEDPPFFVRAMMCAGWFYAVSVPVYLYRYQPGHVTWRKKTVIDTLKGYKELLDLCEKYQLDLLFYETIERLLCSEYFHEIIEASLREGNTYVASFFQTLRKFDGHELLKGKKKLDFEYINRLCETNNISVTAEINEKNCTSNKVSVSIIMPVYNVADYLPACLDSILGQTLDNYEVICVEDCSPDNSLEILKEYEKRYPAIRVFNQPTNQGAGKARNLGLVNAKGEYIAFMDADDMYHSKDTLRNLYETAKEKDALICGGGLRFMNNPEWHTEEEKTFSFESSGWVEYKDFQQHFYYQRFIYSREMLKKNGIEFPNYLRYQDPPFFVRAMTTAGKFYALKQPVYVYRNDGSHVKWTIRKVTDFLKGNSDLLDLCVEHGLADMLYDTIKHMLQDRYIKTIVEKALIDGNDDVIDFYAKIATFEGHELLGKKPELNFDYAKELSSWTRERNCCYHARSINLQDKPMALPPVISIVVPVYNTSKHLTACIDSLLSQTYQDFEIICIDDGSTDESAWILDEYEKKHTRVHVYHQENQGLSAARNAGMQHAQGKYVYFMDSDDMLSEDALFELVSMADENNLDIIFFGAKAFFDDDVPEQMRKNSKLMTPYHRNGNYPIGIAGTEMFLLQRKNGTYYTCVPFQFYRTAFLRDAGIASYEGLLHEDNLFTLQSIMHASRTGVIDKPFFQRRIRGNSIMTSKYNYRNALGFYLTVIELQKLGLELVADNAYSEFTFLINELLSNNMSWRWQELSEAQQVLFYASLTPDDRVTFQSIVCPIMRLRHDYIALKSNTPSVNQKSVLNTRQLNDLKNEVKALRESYAYRIGRKITWLPHKIKTFFDSKKG